TERQLLAVADGRQPIGADALPDVVVLHALRALRAESEVVFDGAAAVAVAFELDLGARVLAQPFEVLREAIALALIDLGVVVAEGDVLHDAILSGTLTALGARAARADESFLAETARAALFAGALLVLAGARAQHHCERTERDQRRPLRRHRPHPHLTT